MRLNHDLDLLISGYLNGILTPEEDAELKKWIAASSENYECFVDACARWELSMSTFTNKKFRAVSGWKRLMVRINPKGYFRLQAIRFLKVAAVFIIAFISAFLLFEFKHFPPSLDGSSALIINETPKGNKSYTILPDGSRVWINAGSKISYSVDFNRKSRDIFLEGEAYFDVNTHRGKPFNVHASGIKISATGTSFNVRAYREDGFVETTLVEGKVWVNRTDASRKEAVELNPSQKFTVMTYSFDNAEPVKSEKAQEEQVSVPENTSQTLKSKLVTQVSTEHYTSWKDEQWIIYRENFRSLAVKLERRYDVEITFSDDRIDKLAFSGKLKDETLEQVMNVICQTAPVRYKLEGKKVNVWYNDEFDKK